MEEIFTPNQELLIHHLVAVGCDLGRVLRIVYEVWEEHEVIQMLEFCRDNPQASPQELLSASLKISPPEDEEEEYPEEE
ncbi:MAG: hypothetical protein IJP38_09145 [Oscillospiraceae bacterium]|nr:hypothetical protein [Oscillospiraceae bacterium]